MKSKALFAGLAILFCFLSARCVGQQSGAETKEASVDKREKKSEWVSIFNGKDLTGWTPKITTHELGKNPGDTFRVVDGCLTVSYEKYDDFKVDGKEQFGHIFYKEKLSNYVIRCEYRFIGKQVANGPGWARRNSGIMLHCQDPKTMAVNQKFPVSIEVQLLGGFGQGKRPTANLCTPGTNVVMDDKLVRRHCNQSTSDTFHGDQWVTVEVEVRGGKKISHKVNGKEVLSYEKPQLDPNDGEARKLIKDEDKLILNEGYISLQSESHPVQFRKVELKKLDDESR